MSPLMQEIDCLASLAFRMHQGRFNRDDTPCFDAIRQNHSIEHIYQLISEAVDVSPFLKAVVMLLTVDTAQPRDTWQTTIYKDLISLHAQFEWFRTAQD